MAAAKWCPHLTGPYQWRDHEGQNTALDRLPDGFILLDSMDLSDYPGQRLPQGLIVGQWAMLNGSQITSISEQTEVYGSFTAQGARSLETIEQNVRFFDNATLQDLPRLRCVEPGFAVQKWLTIKNCPNLEALPEGLAVGSSLHIQGCESLRELPRGMKIARLEIVDCPNIQSIPDDIEFVGTGYIYDKIGVGYCGNSALSVPETYFERDLVRYLPDASRRLVMESDAPSP